MRDIALLAAVALGLGVALFYPFAGVLLWTWFTLQNPHQETYGFATGLPFNMAIAVVTVGAWLLSGESKLPRARFLVWIMFVFLAWMTFNSFFAFDPRWSWPYWNETWKIFALGFLVATMATSRVRIDAVVWTIVLSLFYYGVKGGIFTIVTGGGFHVVGPPHTIIGDNNQLALALLMCLPLANYLRLYCTNKNVSRAMLAGMGLTLISVLGSYSRGAIIALGALAVFGWLRSTRKLLYVGVAAIFLVGALSFMPAAYWSRVNTIQNAQQDQSFTDRLQSWQVTYHYANDHFPFGAGFYGPQLGAIYDSYFPGQTPHAAHSIYFQVLGEHGYIGLALYLIVIAGAFVQTVRIRRKVRGRLDLAWIDQLTLMIQMSLVAFCVGGAALSMAYYDMFILLIALLIPLSTFTETRRVSYFTRADSVGRDAPSEWAENLG